MRRELNSREKRGGRAVGFFLREVMEGELATDPTQNTLRKR